MTSSMVRLWPSVDEMESYLRSWTKHVASVESERDTYRNQVAGLDTEVQDLRDRLRDGFSNVHEQYLPQINRLEGANRTLESRVKELEAEHENIARVICDALELPPNLTLPTAIDFARRLIKESQAVIRENL
jgi:iron-sulfur cluster repair protein YtfE (RIC family)